MTPKSGHPFTICRQALPLRGFAGHAVPHHRGAYLGHLPQPVLDPHLDREGLQHPDLRTHRPRIARASGLGLGISGSEASGLGIRGLGPRASGLPREKRRKTTKSKKNMGIARDGNKARVSGPTLRSEDLMEIDIFHICKTCKGSMTKFNSRRKKRMQRDAKNKGAFNDSNGTTPIPQME